MSENEVHRRLSWASALKGFERRPGMYMPCGASLILGAELLPRWFPQLPFTLEAVRKRIPPEMRSVVEIEWHEQDDILDCSVGRDLQMHAVLRM